MTQESEIEKEKRQWKIEQDLELLKAKIAILEFARTEFVTMQASMAGVINLMKLIGLISSTLGAFWFMFSFIKKDGL